MNEFGSEMARAAAVGMCRPGWQELNQPVLPKNLFGKLTLVTLTAWPVTSIRVTTVIVVQWRRELHFPGKKAFSW